MFSTGVVATAYAFSSWPETSVRPSTMPSICVVPIFFVTDQQMPTGSMWNTASPMSQRNLSMPAQNGLISTSVFVPFSKRYSASMQLRKPRMRPPTMMAGMIGAKISAMTATARCSAFWFDFAAAFTASFDTPSMPATAVKSL